MSEKYESMYARHRNAAGMTQERAAELLGVAPRTLQAWERGESTPHNARVLAMCDIYCSPTLAIEHLRYSSIIAYDVLPAVKAVPVAQAVCQLLSAIRKLEEIHAGDKLLQIAADGKVDEIERADFEQLLIELDPIMAAVLSLRYAVEG
jgi:transcriptional regulator with XRE-family HTH domain